MGKKLGDDRCVVLSRLLVTTENPSRDLKKAALRSDGTVAVDWQRARSAG